MKKFLKAIIALLTAALAAVGGFVLYRKLTAADELDEFDDDELFEEEDEEESEEEEIFEEEATAEEPEAPAEEKPEE